MISCQKEITINVSAALIASAYWKFEEIGNVDRFDSILGLDATVFVSIPTGNTPGKIGQAVALPAAPAGGNSRLFGDIFNGGTGTAWSALTYPAVKGASLTFWVRFDNPNFAAFFELLFTAQDAGGTINGGFRLRSDFAPALSLNVDTFTRPGAVATTQVLGTVSLSVFHFIALTYDQPTDKLTMYLDNVNVGSVVTGGPWQASTNSGILIHYASYYQSIVDELGWYNNYVLTATDVAQLWNSGNGARPSNVP